ncbi:unnamed protein product [Caenorhabditis sp. 36 PRJEB53466]|nr:unnamed protein product [Caenorhabditis sp. 36 PRJEB53466]
MSNSPLPTKPKVTQKELKALIAVLDRNDPSIAHTHRISERVYNKAVQRGMQMLSQNERFLRAWAAARNPPLRRSKRRSAPPIRYQAGQQK